MTNIAKGIKWTYILSTSFLLKLQ